MNKHILTNIHPYKYIKGSMRQWYLYSTKWDKNMVVILHIDGDKAICLIFYDGRDTESK